jgi:putative cardiolipin synthase
MATAIDKYIQEAAFRLELVKNANGSEGIRWHGLVDGQEKIFNVDPYTGFWRRFGIWFMGLLPIESQL